MTSPNAAAPAMRQIVGEHAAVKTQLAAQHPGDPAAATGWPAAASTAGNTTCAAITPGNVVVDQRPIGPHVGLQIDEFAPVHRHRHMRIGDHRAMPRKVLGDRRHARLAHARHVRPPPSAATASGSRVEGSIADDLADAVVEIDAGREAEIHAHGAQFAGHQPADGLRQRQARRAGPRRSACPGAARPASRVNPSRKRCTRPPSWSTAISKCGVRKARMAAVSAVTCAGSR